MLCKICGQKETRTGRPTCSQKCGGILRRRPMGLRKKDGYICKDGYRMVRHNKWYIKEHRKLMSERIGRELKKKEVVHHWDEVRLNNEKENLALFKHQAAHKRLHLFAVRHGLEVIALKFDQPWL